MPPHRVLVLYNEPVLPEDHPDYESEYEVVETADVVAMALTTAGFGVTPFGVGRDPSVLISGLREHKPDVVFNLFEGAADHGHTEAYVAGILEWLGISFTGSPAQALWLAREKHMAKYLLAGAGLPTPEFMVVERLPVAECKLGWPVIVKPALQDASVGIDQNSVVTSQRQLEERVCYIMRKYGPPVLVERFVCGREFNVSLVEKPDPASGTTIPALTTLPVSEIQFLDGDGSNFWPLVTYDAKWHPDSRDFKATPPRFPGDLRPDFIAELTTIARRAFRLIGCRDYARIDFRSDAAGKPYILEVNPNPCISPLAGLASSLEHAGQTHASFVVGLVQTALARKTGPRHAPTLPDSAIQKLIPNPSIT